MARMRLKTWPKTAIHNTGWTARAKSSVGSRSSFLSSISATAPVWRKKSSTAEESSETASDIPCAADVTIASLLLQRAATVMHEDIVERGFGADTRLQIRRLADGGDLAEMHDRQLIAQLIGLIHGMGGEQHGHLQILAKLEQAVPHATAGDGVKTD